MQIAVSEDWRWGPCGDCGGLPRWKFKAGPALLWKVPIAGTEMAATDVRGLEGNKMYRTRSKFTLGGAATVRLLWGAVQPGLGVNRDFQSCLTLCLFRATKFCKRTTLQL